MRRWWLVVALLLSLGVNLGLVGVTLLRQRALAAWSGERPALGPEPGDPLARRLGLAEPERQRFLAVQQRLAEAVRDERRELGRLRRMLRDELIAPAPDPARIEELVGELAEHQLALDRAFVRNVLDSRELLDAEQLERYLLFLERFTAQRFGRPDEGPEPRFGLGRAPGEGPPRRPPPDEAPRPRR